MITHRPDHDVSVGLAFRAIMNEPQLLPSILEAGADLTEELRQMASEGRTFPIS